MKAKREILGLEGAYSELLKLVYDKYGTKLAFCQAIRLNQANLNKNLNGTYKMSIERMFMCANALGIPVERMLEWFWRDELEQNRNSMQQKMSL